MCSNSLDLLFEHKNETDSAENSWIKAETGCKELTGRDIKVESFKVDTRVGHFGRQKKWIGHLGRNNYIFRLT
jgi:hypothetical protein